MNLKVCSLSLFQRIFLYFIFLNLDETISVATTRPETLFGDVAIAVNPSDAR
jgi:valyl-tRNA synthetase